MGTRREGAKEEGYGEKGRKGTTVDTKTQNGRNDNLYLATAIIIPYLLLRTEKNMEDGINKWEVNGRSHGGEGSSERGGEASRHFRVDGSHSLP